MKIHLSIPVAQVEGIRKAEPGASAPARDRPADQVELSGPARFIQDLREAASTTPQVRADAVASARADIASGQLGSAEDIEATLDGLLAGW